MGTETAAVMTDVLVQRARDDDADAMQELIALHATGAYRLAVAILGNEQDAQDAVQDAFVAAWSQLGKLREPASFGIWLRRITVNVCRMSIRRRTRRRETAMEESEQRTVESRSDEMVDLEVAFEALDVEKRAALVLHYVEGRPLAEIADVLGIPVGTVKSRLFAGREALRKALSR